MYLANYDKMLYAMFSVSTSLDGMLGFRYQFRNNASVTTCMEWEQRSQNLQHNSYKHNTINMVTHFRLFFWSMIYYLPSVDDATAPIEFCMVTCRDLGSIIMVRGPWWPNLTGGVLATVAAWAAAATAAATELFWFGVVACTGSLVWESVFKIITHDPTW